MIIYDHPCSSAALRTEQIVPVHGLFCPLTSILPLLFRRSSLLSDFYQLIDHAAGLHILYLIKLYPFNIRLSIRFYLCILLFGNKSVCAASKEAIYQVYQLSSLSNRRDVPSLDFTGSQCYRLEISTADNRVLIFRYSCIKFNKRIRP